MSQNSAKLIDVMSKESFIILEMIHHNTGTLQNVFVFVHIRGHLLVNKEAKLSRQQTHSVENITHFLGSIALSSLETPIKARL